MPVRAVLERGPKERKVVAYAVDWPGWTRGAKTAELALARLEAYRQRYRPVAVAAKLKREFDAAGPLEGGGELGGMTSADFWGFFFAASSLEQDPMDQADLERKIALLRGCWKLFDEVAGS